MSTSLSPFFAVGAINAFIAVAAGAFGAHALKKRLDADLLAIFEIGVRYQMYHAIGLLAVAWLASRGAPHTTTAGIAMTTGIVLFSGSLYLLALTGTRWLGAITPLGGVGFLIGWALLAYGALKAPSPL